MKKGSTTQYAEILYALIKDQSSDDIHKILKTYIAFLSRKKALGKIKEIIEKFEKIENNMDGTISALLTTSDELTEKEKEEIIHALKKEMNVKKVILNEKIDKKLIAGWKIRTENYLIDGSTRGRLNKLQIALMK